MLHTNLIGDRASAAQRLRQALRTARLATLMVGLGAVFIPLLLSGILSARATRLREVKQERLALAATVARHQALTAEIARLTDPAAVASAAHFNAALWHDLLRELRDRMPAGVWLTSVDVAAAAGPGGQRLTLTGQADDHEAIGGLVAALTGSPWFAAAQLQSSAPVAGSDAPYAFTIETVLRRAVAPKAAPEVSS